MSVQAPAAGTARLAAIAFGILLAATFGAFFLASRLKAEPAVLADLHRLRYFSPNGDGHRDVQRIRFRAELDDSAAVDIVDADGARVRRIEENLRIRRGRTAVVRWDGRDDDGRRAPDGRYRMRLILRGEGRAVLSGRGFELDTRPPRPAVLVDSAQPIVAPGQPVGFRVRGMGSRSAPRFEVLRTDVSPPRVVRRFAGAPGRMSYAWDGRDDQGRPVGPGTYLIAVTARDRAGNAGTGPPLPPSEGTVEGRPGVTVRALAVQPPVQPVKAGALVGFRVDARGRRYGWSVRRLGTSRPVLQNRRPKHGTTLILRAPTGQPSGVYLLQVRSGGATARVPFAVQAQHVDTRRRPLIVLPMITWLGRDPVDDSTPRDGLGDTFANGADARFPRLFAYDGGLPAGFADGIAPLLVWMDRNEIRYDVTTDLALSLGEELSPGDRRGMLFAGAPEWVSRGLARRLRGYVDDGGRVAVFGPGALRAGVTVLESRLTRATPPGPTDAFGARLAAPRTLHETPLSVIREDPELGLLEGVSGVLTGFSTVEDLISPGPRSQLATGVGVVPTEQELAQAEADNRTPPPERPALSAVTLGRGMVIRIGLPQWVDRLVAGDAAVGQITHNVLDLLSGAAPRPRTAR